MRRDEHSKSIHSPLWLLSLFIALTEVVAGFAATRTTDFVQVWFTVFATTFPVLVLGLFGLVLWYRPYAFYAPRDYPTSTSVADFVRAVSGANDQRDVAVVEAITKAVATTLQPETQSDGLSQTLTDDAITHLREGRIVVDLHRIWPTGSDSSLITYSPTPSSTVKSLLNHIYFAIQDTVGAYTYGTSWILTDDQDRPMWDIGDKWARHNGEMNDIDTRRLEEAGIKPGTTLHVVPL